MVAPLALGLLAPEVLAGAAALAAAATTPDQRRRMAEDIRQAGASIKQALEGRSAGAVQQCPYAASQAAKDRAQGKAREKELARDKPDHPDCKDESDRVARIEEEIENLKSRIKTNQEVIERFADSSHFTGDAHRDIERLLKEIDARRDELFAARDALAACNAKARGKGEQGGKNPAQRPPQKQGGGSSGLEKTKIRDRSQDGKLSDPDKAGIFKNPFFKG